MRSIPRIVTVSAVLALGLIARAQDANKQPPQNPQNAQNPQPGKITRQAAKALLKKLVGKWEGDCQTWFKPGKLEDDSKVTGEFTEILDGRFLRHTYTGSMKGKPRKGEDTLAFDAAMKQFQSAWMDDFHMNYAMLFSNGDATPNGFFVRGEYAMGPDKPKWGWKTVFALLDDDHLTITAYNILPEGTEYEAVKTTYRRVK